MPTASLGAARPGLLALKRGAVTLAAVLLLGAGSTLQAAPAEPPSGARGSPSPAGALRTEVASLLERPDAFPPYESRWKPLGPAALGVLEEMASDPKAPVSQRAQAVSSMAAVDHPQATDRLRALVQDARAQAPLRASAVTALGLRVGTEAVSTLLPLLEDRDAHVRMAAARALGRLGGAEVQHALEERLPVEEAPLVREALQQGLTFVEP
ncbi:HEAT repeat domain-containing protein [Hyalangium rubrum]|uniref:HEAT repeat domain-containing protein n=1 Tax=Hyalangium rubrum TaxID=3103134 RepID=A0ABU5HFR7_9BACT|nr:HEAT repeat domain-containing protein [Hyalangium sp. s54d21]MDY7230905.1 HEAT repeat domain-containing protein [Hyalangium sp. s54d21]